ncbi:hypothetical protein HPB48_025859 [Haemaphysalis longicornis]|uniref:DUF5641 domain-containing protein n=1 Tax=Haemaphysalis longicornis TaxID=44386 RepID=A0A9J6HAM6_HAELO|nr:hypothetical protein HPB48_025859 [Haemaphysalis longicornis]
MDSVEHASQSGAGFFAASVFDKADNFVPRTTGTIVHPVGANDIAKTPARVTFQRYEKLLASIRHDHPQIRTVYATLILPRCPDRCRQWNNWRAVHRFNSEACRFNDLLHRHCLHTRGLFHLDHGLEWLPSARVFAADDIHPNFGGVAIMASHLHRAMLRNFACSQSTWLQHAASAPSQQVQGQAPPPPPPPPTAAALSSEGRQQSSPPRIDPPTAVTLATQSPSSALHGCELCNARDHVIAYCRAPISPEGKRKRLQPSKATTLQSSASQRTVWYAAFVRVGTLRRSATSNARLEGSKPPAEPDPSRSDRATIGTANADSRQYFCRQAVHGASAQAASCSSAFCWILGVSAPSSDAMCPAHSIVSSTGALFLSLGEAPPEGAAADVELSFMWRLEAIGIQGTSENLGFNDPAATAQLPSRLQVGDVVLVQDNSPPAFWQLGRILQLFPGRDGVDYRLLFQGD